jgi:hypothetical protein
MAEDYVEFASNMMLFSWTRSSAPFGRGQARGSVTTAAASGGGSKATTTTACGYPGAAAAAGTGNNGRTTATATTTTTTTNNNNGGHDRLHYYPPETISALSYLKSPMRRPMVLERWSPYEVAIFEATLAQYGKDFLQVQKELASSSSSSSFNHNSNHYSKNGNHNNSNGKSEITSHGDAASAASGHLYQYCNKTTKDVVEFYYIWKKTSHYQRWKATYVAPHDDDSDDDDDDIHDENEEDKNTKKDNEEPLVKPKRKYTRRVPPAATAAATVGEAGSNK